MPPRKPAPEPGSESAPAGIRIQRLLAAAGVDARRGAEALIRAGRVTVNGRVARLGERADPTRDRIALDGEAIRPERRVYWMLNKPRGVVTTTSDPEGRPTAVSLVPERAARLFPVGRLDAETEGLLLLTNDGMLAHALLHPSHEIEREYEVAVQGEIPPRVLERLARGVRLEDGWTAPARVSRVRRDPEQGAITLFHLTIVEGRKRQIRRALFALGHPVRRLRRLRFGPLRLGELPRGSARRLDAREQQSLERLAARALSRAKRQDAGRSGSKSRPRKPKRRARGASRAGSVSN
jgi:23S rRNA pseudouridine2605 synthase